MCGVPGTAKRQVSRAEVEYLDALVRGVYAKRDLPLGHAISESDIYLAVPLTKGQLSCRELIAGEVLSSSVLAHQPITIFDVDNPYSRVSELREQIEQRGI
jgi:N-acetylneuraminate synthase